jgi:anthranilate 1,2-dioxygenase small subunit
VTNRELRFEAEELLDRYVQCLDEDRLEEWPDFFSENGVYKIISRVNVERMNHPLATMLCDSRDMMKDRVAAIRNASGLSQRYLRHLVSNVRVTGQEGGAHIVKSNYVVLQTIQGEETKVFNAGQYADKIIFGDGGPKFQEKLVIYDTIQIPGLLLVPI